MSATEQTVPRVVAHLVAGYPTAQASLDVARGLVSGGAYALEVQIPFSDPTADGPAIEEACRLSIEAGFSVSDTWDLIGRIRSEIDVPIFVMSYASLVVTPGVAAFVHNARDAGATGLIVPDLSPGSDEGLYGTASEAGCPAVPVAVPWITPARQREILAEPIEWVYVALRRGITGTYTRLGTEQEIFLGRLRDSGVRVMAGFGVQSHEQIETIVTHADAAVVGSHIVRAVAEAPAGGEGRAARNVMRTLLGTQSS